jgi:3-oxoacyl-[acyl-carrier-protein] synthase II
MAMQEGLIPATLNLDNQDPRIALDVVADKPRNTAASAALVNAFGFGGHNVVLAFQRP